MKSPAGILLIIILGLGCWGLAGCCKWWHWHGGVFVTTDAVDYAIRNEQDKKKAKEELEKARQEANTVTVNVACQNGSINPVVLKRQGNVYVGPKGEQYFAVPTAEQLQKIYGF